MSFKVLSTLTFQQQITNFYVNHRLGSKDGETLHFWVGKQWNVWLVINHIFHEQIKEEVNKQGELPPNERIAKWASALTNVISRLSEEDLTKYTIIAKEWKAQGPLKEIQRR